MWMELSLLEQIGFLLLLLGGIGCVVIMYIVIATTEKARKERDEAFEKYKEAHKKHYGYK